MADLHIDTKTGSTAWPYTALLLCLAAILAAIPLAFKLDMYDQFELPKIILLRILSGLALLFFVIKAWNEGGLLWRQTPLDMPVFVWGIWNLVKTIDSYSPAISWRGEYDNFSGSLSQINYCLLYFLTTQIVTNWRQVAGFLGVFLASVCAVAIYALMQSIGLQFSDYASAKGNVDGFSSTLGNPNFLGGLITMAIPVAVTLTGTSYLLSSKRAVNLLWGGLLGGVLWWTLIVPATISGSLGAFVKQLLLLRNSIVFWNSILGLLCLILIPILVIKGRLRLGRQIFALMALLILTTALLNTESRGALFGTIVACASLSIILIGSAAYSNMEKSQRLHAFCSLRKYWLIGVIVGLTFVISALILSETNTDRFRRPLADAKEQIDKSRGYIWRPALEIIKDHPIAGTGVDTFKTMFPRYSNTEFSKQEGENRSSRSAHSEPLNIAATTGLVGLAIWFWIICVWAKSWLNHWKVAAIKENKRPAVLLATLAAVWAGYHTQSLFNVAVVSISVPFWIASALLFGLGENYGYKQVFESKPLVKFFTLSGALFCAFLLPFFANRAYLADRHYNIATILVEEAQRLDNHTLTDIYSKGESVYRQLKLKEDLFNGVIEEEFLIREKQLLQARETLHADASPLNSKNNDIRKTVEILLFLLSVNRQETALRLTPSEVKYHVFLGFLYEELFKRATIINTKASWFELASVSYQKAVELNPENAYYRANLGRLHGMVASKPLDLAMTKAESFYMEAIQRARFTPIFYNNLNNLYITTGELKKVLETINLAENASPQMGGRVALTAGIVTYQYARDFLEAGENEKAGIYGWWAFACMHKATQLNPNEADVFYYLAVFYYLKDEKEKASKYVSKALKINPNYARAVVLSRKVSQLPKQPSRL